MIKSWLRLVISFFLINISAQDYIQIIKFDKSDGTCIYIKTINNSDFIKVELIPEEQYYVCVNGQNIIKKQKKIFQQLAREFLVLRTISSYCEPDNSCLTETRANN
ncbi:MAG: hypothetical protein P4L22_06345 [Candidatus Babeliales bacterium]|nr:hypothetical protein [Candidatus Babeliales bacterium]